MPRAVAILNGRRIRSELDRLKITQRKFAQLTGLRPNTITDAVNDKALLPATIFEIARGIERAVILVEKESTAAALTPPRSNKEAANADRVSAA